MCVVQIPMPKGSATDASHAGAMFGGSMSVIANSKQLENISQKAYSLAVDQDSFMHPYVSSVHAFDRFELILSVYKYLVQMFLEIIFNFF